MECVSLGRSLHAIPARLIAGLRYPAYPLPRRTYISGARRPSNLRSTVRQEEHQVVQN